MTPEAYARQLKQLLPPGRLWLLEPTSWLSKLLTAVADELARIDGRGEDLLREWDPRSALETLDDWERVLGLFPEPTATVSERQNAVAARLVARGGQTPEYFVDLAARLGFVATITVTAPYTWRVNVNLSASSAAYTLRVSEFRAGASRAGDRVANRDIAVLETEINRAKPAHTLVLFAYV